MNQDVLHYIETHWEKTIKPSNDLVPFPFNSPSETVHYVDFYYWDLYFINKGLLLTGLDLQAENNIKNMDYFVKKYGYVPNSDILLNRSQPPVFTLAVWDLYTYRKDKKVLETYIDSLLKEHDFFIKNRNTPYGLGAFGSNATDEEVMEHYRSLSSRVMEYSDDPKVQYQIGKDILAIAESGLDFNLRFRTKDSKIAAHEFLHLDLNSWLYAVEDKLSDMLSILGREDEAKEFSKMKEERKQKMEEYFYSEKEGIYLDYNFVRKDYSKLVTAVSLYPFALGVFKDKERALRVLPYLELPEGISCASNHDGDVFYQWDYPTMWGETTLLIYMALKNVGAKAEAKRIKDKYMAAIEKEFEKTGKLWEKYSALDGSIMNVEYAAPPFMGWTAAAYQIFANEKE